MKLIHKARNFYQQAYTTGHFPPTRHLFFGEQKVFAYYGFLGDRNFGDELVFESAKKLFYPNILLPVRRKMPLLQAFYAKACKSRIAGLVVGGGTLIGPLWEREFFEGLVELAKPVYVHGTGVRENIERRDGWKHMLSGKVYGGVRGPHSVENLGEIFSQALITGDAAFAMCEAADKRAQAAPAKTVLINCGAHLGFEGQDNTRITLNQFVEHLNIQGFQVQFLPLHSIDLALGLELKEKHPSILVLDIPSTYQEARNYFLNAQFSVGERLHFTVMAILAGCPFLSINYGKKHDDLLASLDLVGVGVTPNQLSLDLIRAAFEQREMFDWTSIFHRIEALKALQQKEASAFVSSIQ